MRRSRFIFAATAGLAALACLPAWRQPHQSNEPRFDGEYGLWVSRSVDTLRVAWFTAARAPGFLQVLDAGRTVHQATTPADTVHSVTFIHRGGANLLLRYGGEGSTTDRHETTIRLDAARRRPPVAHSGVDSIFVISDIHGEFDTLTAVLRNARIIDARNQWTAGHAHLVVAGDIMDRGKDVVRALWFLYGLEAQAERAGGRVDIVAGNHE
ncbi:MAG: metallophosphoesterase, partial [Longimicrobiales bacterium]